MKPTVLITGGTGLLGQEFARGFLLKGYHVLFTSRSRANAEKLAAELTSELPQAECEGIELDLSDPSAVRGFLGSWKKPVEVLVNNARSLENLRLDATGKPSPDQWSSEFTISVISPFALATGLAEKNLGLKSVINISSIYGMVAPNLNLYPAQASAPPIHYGVAKAALLQMTKELAVRLAPSVRVNAVSFGGVEGRAPQTFVSKYSEMSPQRRMLSQNELFPAVFFLAGEGSSAVTGANIVADGGWTAW